LSFDHGLKPGYSIDNSKLTSIFKCSPQGGMRRSLETNTLLLISNHIKSIYDDRWVGNVLHYTGMGLAGDQNLQYSQNKTLNESLSNGVALYLFEVFEDHQYTFRGPVRLNSNPYQEKQPDQKGLIRNVWIFPVELIDIGFGFSLEDHHVSNIQNYKESVARKLSINQLIERARYSKESGTRNVSTQFYERNCYTSELAKRLAKGICSLCNEPAPFLDKDKRPFLETHHIVWLSKEGPDTIENTVALCPNCHRKMHILNLQQDIERLQSLKRNTLDLA
jgi:5-methylcytosine-specific restriction enzyme A